MGTDVKGLRFGALGLIEKVAVLDPRPGRFGRDRKMKKRQERSARGARCKSGGFGMIQGEHSYPRQVKHGTPAAEWKLRLGGGTSKTLTPTLIAGAVACLNHCQRWIPRRQPVLSHWLQGDVAAVKRE